MKYLLFLLPTFFCQAASLTFSSSPAPLVVSQANAGSEPLSVTDTSTVCDLTVSPKKVLTILASLDTPLEANTSLKMTLSLPSRQEDSLFLTSTPQTLASTISEGSYSSVAVSYEYKATVAAGVVPPQPRTIFFTLLEQE